VPTASEPKVPTRRGRPRNPDIERTVLEETRQLLGERGFAATTVQEIATRSGVHPPAIYRRWPSRIALIEDAALSGLPLIDVPPTGELRSDLLRFLRAYEANLATAAARAALPGLIAAYQHHEPEPTTRWLYLSVRPQFYAILQDAHAALDPAVDPDEVFDLLLGAVLTRVLVPPVSARRGWAERTADMLVKVLHAGPAPCEPRTTVATDRRTTHARSRTSAGRARAAAPHPKDRSSDG
jgi:AcrR family transcriptional regulator